MNPNLQVNQVCIYFVHTTTEQNKYSQKFVHIKLATQNVLEEYLLI